MRITKSLLILLISLASPAFGQDTPEIDPSPEVDPPPVREDGEYEPGFDTDGTNIEGDLNTSNSNNNNVSKTYNGAGAGRQMPANTAMFMSATPCPIIRSGRLLVGKNAVLAIKQNPAMWIPDYEEDKAFYDELLAGGGDDSGEQESNSGSLSERFRSTKRDRD